MGAGLGRRGMIVVAREDGESEIGIVGVSEDKE